MPHTEIEYLSTEEHATLLLIAIRNIQRMLRDASPDYEEIKSIVDLCAADEVPVHAVLDYLCEDGDTSAMPDDSLVKPFVQYLLHEIG